MLAFSDDFDEMTEDLDALSRKLMKRFQKEMDKIFTDVGSGKIKGVWETREIDEPHVKGFIVRGRFGFDESLEPLEPMKPLRRRPLPEKPFDLSKKETEETREPLTDVFNEENTITVYVELPGEEKEDIQLRFTNGGLEVKAKSFYKIIELPSGNLETNSLTSEYKNGVLKVTIPKKKEYRREHTGERMV